MDIINKLISTHNLQDIDLAFHLAYRNNYNIESYINDIYKRLNRLDGVIDVTDVKVVQKTGTGYSNLSFNMQNNMSPDGTIIYVPEDTVFELKYFTEDIKGTIK